MMPSIELLKNKRTRTKVAACEAVGLNFWGEHPAAGCVWAVDDGGSYHVVRIFYSSNTAAHSCGCYSGGDSPCSESGTAHHFTTPESHPLKGLSS